MDIKPIKPKTKEVLDSGDVNEYFSDHIELLEERVATLEADLAALTKDYQQEFEKINELMGVMVDKLAEHDARIKSLEHPK